MRLASLFPGINSSRVRSISGQLLFLKASHISPPVSGLIRSARVRQPMFRTDTTRTPRLNKLIRRTSVPAVLAETLDTSKHYRAEWLGIARSLNGYIAA